MSIRGTQSIWPVAGKAETGILSSKGKQKMDSTEKFEYKGAMKYAYGSSSRSRPSGNGNQGLRHQAPKKRK